MAKIIDGKALSEEIIAKTKVSAEEFEKKHSRKPSLAVVLVGDDEASKVYVGSKIKRAETANIESIACFLPANTTQEVLEAKIKELNESDRIDGILVQLPLPKHLDEKKIVGMVRVDKDVDAFSNQHMGDILLGHDGLVSCTPAGIIELIKSTGETIAGKNAVVVGRSNIVGKPVAMLLLNESATVTICHSKTKDLAFHTKNADILVVSIGRKEFIHGKDIKKGAIVIDVGINRHDGKLYGDVEFQSAEKVASHITPVPGGVGPMTIAMLMANTLKAAEIRVIK
ncbi:MAG: bifunctional 5,10-methylenetetrahydrofolate dehydrogenase/5,10-methenyltetrahydrofolate cyclohydrolase [Firmicutes bacterium]|nr:bifunctional 5,10-methylenetetrahydrofolate dehydrogenase/5,10-methenyltetrahydrofolate cyclohydrolase [Bacillota bacterium]MCL2255685.1 bifunctional 5,10-methylenetetrahydrofolate dehydrogenase/5,10-methenyltetrahydrofolate cyclohydrolase [Bacillota bacterium]